MLCREENDIISIPEFTTRVLSPGSLSLKRVESLSEAAYYFPSFYQSRLQWISIFFSTLKGLFIIRQEKEFFFFFSERIYFPKIFPKFEKNDEFRG